MLKKSQKISGSEFDVIRKIGRIAHNRYLKLTYIAGNKKSFAVVIPRRVVKSAVERNALKRRLYAFLQKEQKALPPLQTIIMLSKNFLSLAPEQQCSVLADALAART